MNIIGSLEADSGAAISGVRLWGVLRRFFRLTAESIETDHPPLTEKLRRASPHWMRHYIPFRIMSGSAIELRDRPTITDRKADVLKRSPDIILTA